MAKPGTPESDDEDHSLTTEAAKKIGVDTVEALVRHQLSASLGGKRGMLEAAIPGIMFSAIWLPTKELAGGPDRQPRRRRAGARPAAAPAQLDAVRLQRHLRDRHRLGVRALGRVVGRLGVRPGARVLPAGHPDQPRLHDRVRHVLPDRLAGARVHARRRDRGPDRLAQEQAGREALQPPHLGDADPRRDRRARPGAGLAPRPLRHDRRRRRGRDHPGAPHRSRLGAPDRVVGADDLAAGSQRDADRGRRVEGSEEPSPA